jgi:hypothetical protein
MREWETSIWELMLNPDRPSWIIRGKHDDLRLAANGGATISPFAR